MTEITSIFLIGAMKSGTTTVYDHLSLHPNICFPTVKEPEYFSEKMGISEYKKGDFYDLYAFKERHTHLFDGSTGYTKYPAEIDTPKRIFEYGLKPKFIYIVRNPFDRIQSHYNYMRRDLKWNDSISSNHLVNVSNYYLQLQQYQPYFSKDDFLIVDFDKLKSNYKAVIKEIYDFVGVFEPVISNKSIRANITKPSNRRQLKLNNIIDLLLKSAPYTFRLKIKKGVSLFFNKNTRELSKKERIEIYNKLKKDMGLFNRDYNFDVSKWGFKNYVK